MIVMMDENINLNAASLKVILVNKLVLASIDRLKDEFVLLNGAVRTGAGTISQNSDSSLLANLNAGDVEVVAGTSLSPERTGGSVVAGNTIVHTATGSLIVDLDVDGSIVGEDTTRCQSIVTVRVGKGTAKVLHQEGGNGTLRNFRATTTLSLSFESLSSQEGNQENSSNS